MALFFWFLSKNNAVCETLASAECGARNNATRMQNSECRIQNCFTPLRFAHKDLFKCGMRSNACASAECGTRNAERLCFVYYANKDLFKCGMRSAEERYANAEFWMQNAEFRIASLRYTTLTRKSHMNAEFWMQNAEWLHFANATLTRIYLI